MSSEFLAPFTHNFSISVSHHLPWPFRSYDPILNCKAFLDASCFLPSTPAINGFSPSFYDPDSKGKNLICHLLTRYQVLVQLVVLGDCVVQHLMPGESNFRGRDSMPGGYLQLVKWCPAQGCLASGGCRSICPPWQAMQLHVGLHLPRGKEEGCLWQKRSGPVMCQML